MAPKRKNKGVELKIDFGAGTDPAPVNSQPGARQVQYQPKQAQPEPQQRFEPSPFDLIEEESKLSKKDRTKRQVIDTTKPALQQPQQPQAQKFNSMPV